MLLLLLLRGWVMPVQLLSVRLQLLLLLLLLLLLVLLLQDGGELESSHSAAREGRRTPVIRCC